MLFLLLIFGKHIISFFQKNVINQLGSKLGLPIGLNALVDPALILFKRTGNIWTEIAVNDEWENDNNATAITDLASHLQLPDRNGNDAGLLIDLEPGVYTVQMGSNSGTGLAVIVVDTIE